MPTATATQKKAMPTGQQYMCYAAHRLPAQDLLDASVPLQRQGIYSIRWLKLRLRLVEPLGACAVWLCQRDILLLPLPKQLEATDAPYGLCYDFMLPPGATDVARFYGFVIFTTIAHDWQRSSMFASLGNYAESLLCADRALLSAAQAKPQLLSEAVEKLYTRFRKLRNLACDQYATPEGTLAALRALGAAQKCLASLGVSLAPENQKQEGLF